MHNSLVLVQNKNKYYSCLSSDILSVFWQHSHRTETQSIYGALIGEFDIDIDIYLLTEIRFTPSGSSTVHIYKQTIQRTTQLTL